MILAHLLLSARGVPSVFKHLLTVVTGFGAVLISLLLAGIVARLAGGVLTGTARAYLRHVSRWIWWTESLRLVIVGSLAMHIYTHLKILLFLVTARNADPALWAADYALLFGHSPTVLLLELFGNPRVLRAIDWSYEVVFQGTLYAVFAIALSSPSHRVRHALVGAKSAMWIAGAWLYYTYPSFGPAYRFPEFWDPVAAYMPRTRVLLGALFENFLVVIGKRTGTVNITYGIAAFPSLHVAFQVLVALWARRFSRVAGALALAAAAIIFLGSMVTGWHYLVDSLAGIVLAAVFFWIFFRLYKLPRWLGLLRAVRRSRARVPSPSPLAFLTKAFSVR